jgi:hypothetical protein
MDTVLEIQKKINDLLLNLVESNKISSDRAAEIARKTEMLLPLTLTPDQLKVVLKEIKSIPELALLDFQLNL